MDEILGFVLAIVGLTILIILLALGIAIPTNNYACNKLEQSTGIETKYVFMGGGCLVKVNDRFIPQENWRGEYQQ